MNLFNKASTFSPLGSLSSTGDIDTKTDKEKLQKVKVKIPKLEFNNKNIARIANAVQCHN